MDKNRKQWRKYAAVVLAFVVMAGLFMPGTKTQVNATGTEGSVSGGNVTLENQIMTITDNKSISVIYNLGYEDAIWQDGKPADMILPDDEGRYSITELVPVRAGFKFVAWVKDYGLESAIYYESGDVLGTADDFVDVSSIELTARWEEMLANWPITVVYDLGADDVTWNAKYENKINPVSGSYFINIPAPDPVRKGYEFVGWVKESDDIKYKASDNIEISGRDIDESTQITFTAQWEWDGESITESGKTYSLKAGTPYTLGTGTWTVSGDDYNYTGGSTFYVGTDGDYTFTKN